MSVPVIIRRARWVIGAAVAVGLFCSYLLMSRAAGVNADGASNALQGWDMLHGDVLLRGWTVTDVSFYTHELLLFVLVEAVYGLHGDTTHAVAALVFTVLVLVVAVAARGRATGREAATRVALAVSVVAVPALGHATTTQLTSPDHTGTAIPLLLTWLVLERWWDRRWVPYAVAAMLAWGQIADPLVMYIGVLPLILVSLYRLLSPTLLRSRTPRFPMPRLPMPRLPMIKASFTSLELPEGRLDHEAVRGWRREAGLILAGVGSVVLAQLALLGIRVAGGFGAHAAEAKLSPLSELGGNLWLAVRVIAVNYGAYFPDRSAAGYPIAILHLVGLLAATAATLVAAGRLLRRRGDRLCDLVTVGILVNVGAFVVSALPTDLLSARQVVATLPLGAVLVGRIWGPPLAGLLRRGRPAGRRVLVALVAVGALLAGELVVHASDRGAPGHAEDVAAWLDDRGLAYGLGEYWNANNVTVLTSRRVRVAPVVAGDRIAGYQWESDEEWYDPTRHDARFLVLDTRAPSNSEATARAQFGAPVERHAFDGAVVLVYDHNLLVDLPAYCIPDTAPAMSACPHHGLVLF
ncbi:hypothetical protein WEI85_30760 [Actinomycetes bacterium KLBMP 9797]